MKQVTQNLKSGVLSVEDVPPPQLRLKGVLVHTHYSVISLGTEVGTAKLAKKNLLKKAKARPKDLRKVIDTAKRDGPLTAYQAAMRTLDISLPYGYSCSGEVIEVGSEVEDLKVGDRVACAGGGYANHAEVVFVPRNLCVRIPDGVSMRDAAFVTLGSIAMQSVRIAESQVGEQVAVIGLGLLGFIASQILQTAGCRVIGIDLDARKVRLAEEMGIDCALERQTPGLTTLVREFADGLGVDQVIITAATESNDPMELATQIIRDRGRIVVVGKIPMDVPRKTAYDKELDIRLSRSYGPGRYDRAYEEKGVDYPIGYVRWTENRNMLSFLRLIESEAINLEPMITHQIRVEETPRVYQDILKGGDTLYLGVVLEYPLEQPVETRASYPERAAAVVKSQKGWVGLGIIGAGSFAVTTLLPVLAKQNKVRLRGIVSASGLSAQSMAKKYKFEYCTGDIDELLADEEIDCLFILTRHDLHGPLTVRALNAGKHVFVEKPMALTEEELEGIRTARRTSGREVMVGFNRRFAPMGRELKNAFARRGQPMMISCRVNTGCKPSDHWLHDPQEGGGRIIGEVCHFVDFLYYLTDSYAARVYAQSIGSQSADLVNDANAHLLLEFADGSIGSICYTSIGDPSFSKERIEVFCDRRVGAIEDFRILQLVEDGRTKTTRDWLGQDKGHKGEIDTLIEALRGERPFPVSFVVQRHVTLSTIWAIKSLRTRQPVELEPPDMI